MAKKRKKRTGKNNGKRLTAQQKRFCEEYVIDLNATQAAIRAKYSKKTAYSTGQRLLKIVEIETKISELKKERQKRLEFSADEVLKKVRDILYADFTQVIGLTPDEVKELPEDVRKLITSFKTKNVEFDGGSITTIDVKFMDKDRALESVCKHIGFYDNDKLHRLDVTSNGKEINTGIQVIQIDIDDATVDFNDTAE